MGKGRPKKTLKDLPDNWETTMLNLGRQGASDVEMRVALGCISDDLWYRLLREEELFAETIRNAKLLCESWWLEEGRVNLKNPKFNYTGYFMQMKNRFGWSNEPRLEKQIDQQNENIESLKAEIRELVKENGFHE